MSHALVIDRWFARLPWSRHWCIAIISFPLVVTPLILAWIDGFTAWTLFVDNRAQFLYVAMMVYLLLALPHVLGSRQRVADGLRPILDVADAEYDDLVARASGIRPADEIIAFLVGALVGWLINVLFEPLGSSPGLFDRYAYFSRILNFGVVAWAFFVLFSVPRLSRALLGHATRVDVFDVTPFEPIGRQSLILALTLIGAAIIGLLSASLQDRFLWREYLIVYSVLLAALVLIFFLNTYPAHRVLLAAKRQQIAFVNRNLARAYFTLQQQLTGSGDALASATVINALAAAKQELLHARTWPYNTDTLRSFFLAVFAPLAVGMARLLMDHLTR